MKRMITLLVSAVALAACSVPTAPTPEVVKAKQSLKVVSDSGNTAARIAKN